MSDKPEEKPKKQPTAHKRTIGGVDFWCEPSHPGAIHDPAQGRDFTDADGAYYWCIPYEEYLKQFRRKYDSQGPIPPYPEPGVD